MKRFYSIGFAFLLFFMLPSYTVFPQNQNKIDSLQTFLKTAKEDTSKVLSLIKLGRLYCGVDYDKAMLTANQAIETSNKINYKTGLSGGFNLRGIIQINLGENNKAIIDLDSAISISEMIGDKKGQSAGYGNLGALYYQIGNYDKALEFDLKCLRIDEALNNTTSTAISLLNIAHIYYIQHNYSDAMSYYKKSLEICQGANQYENKLTEINALIGISAVLQDKKQLNEAVTWLNKALALSDSIGNKETKAQILETFGIIFKNKNEMEKALENLFEAQNIFKEVGNLFGLIQTNSFIAEVYFIKKNYPECIKYNQMVLEQSKQNGIKEVERDALLALSKAYYAVKNFEKAYQYHEQFTSQNDSILNKEKLKQMSEMQVKYETEEKEKELTILKKENQVAEYKKYFLYSLLIFVCLLAVLLISRQRIKISKQAETHRIEQKLVQTELERNKLETQNLHSTLELKQTKLLNYTNLIKEKTQILDKMQEELENIRQRNEGREEPAAEQLLKTVKESINPEQYWEEFITNFNLVYKDFLDQLKSEFPELTRNELRFCALLKCNLGNKEIANILHISPDSVKKSRTRIRKKFELDASENLTKFILEIN